MRRRKRSGWPAVLLVLAVIAVTAFILLRFVFVVRGVQVVGTTGLSNEDVIRHAQIGFGESIFKVDKDEIRRALNSTGTICFEGLQKDYPDGLILQARERKSVAMMMHAGQILVMDADACAMENADHAPNADLVFVSNFNVSNFRIGEPVIADDEQLSAYCAVLHAIEDNGAAGLVSELNLADTQDLRIITRRGIEVELGDENNMFNKIAFMKSAVNDLENRGVHGGVVDVSSGTKADFAPSNK